MSKNVGHFQDEYWILIKEWEKKMTFILLQLFSKSNIIWMIKNTGICCEGACSSLFIRHKFLRINNIKLKVILILEKKNKEIKNPC